MRIHGTPRQIADKYEALAREAQMNGDHVLAQNYLQHAEHYIRVLGEAGAGRGADADADAEATFEAASA